jgi:hypothetical protein
VSRRRVVNRTPVIFGFSARYAARGESDITYGPMAGAII